jgi:hypothetical protein
MFAVLVIMTHGLALPRTRGNLRVRWTALASVATIGTLSLPLFYLFYLRVRHPFVPMNWIPATGPHELVDAFHRLSGHAEIADKGGRLLLLATFAACVSFVWSVWQTRPDGPSARLLQPALFLLLWLFTPVLVLAALSVLHPILLARYTLVSLPALTLIAAEGISAVPRVFWRRIIILGFCALNATELLQYYRFRTHATYWRDAAEGIVKQSRRGDGAIFCVGPGRLLFAYYATRSHHADRIPDSVYPTVVRESDPTNLAYLQELNNSELKVAIGRHERVWVVLYQDRWPAVIADSEHLQTETSRQLSKVSDQRFGDVHVLLYAKPTGREGL